LGDHVAPFTTPKSREIREGLTQGSRSVAVIGECLEERLNRFIRLRNGAVLDAEQNDTVTVLWDPELRTIEQSVAGGVSDPRQRVLDVVYNASIVISDRATDPLDVLHDDTLRFKRFEQRDVVAVQTSSRILEYAVRFIIGSARPKPSNRKRLTGRPADDDIDLFSYPSEFFWGICERADILTPNVFVGDFRMVQPIRISRFFILIDRERNIECGGRNPSSESV
jgi:hypothetical protein